MYILIHMVLHFGKMLLANNCNTLTMLKNMLQEWFKINPATIHPNR